MFISVFYFNKKKKLNFPPFFGVSRQSADWLLAKTKHIIFFMSFKNQEKERKKLGHCVFQVNESSPVPDVTILVIRFLVSCDQIVAPG